MRLSDSKRTKILNAVIQRKYGDRDESLNQRGIRIAEKLVMSKLKGIPWRACRSYLRTSRYVDLVDAPKDKSRYGCPIVSISMSQELPCPNRGRWEFRDKIAAKYAKDYQVFKDEKTAAADQVMAVLMSVNTTNQLYDILPEIKEIAEQALATKEVYPVVAVETISAVRGILAQEGL